MTWIKVDTRLRDKLEVIAIATRLGIDPDLVVGKLVRLWSWADGVTETGSGLTVTRAWIDTYFDCEGLASALDECGWLSGEDGDLSLPNFEAHNGTTAKKRASNQKRVSGHRSRTDSGTIRSPESGIIRQPALCNAEELPPCNATALPPGNAKGAPDKIREEKKREEGESPKESRCPYEEIQSYWNERVNRNVTAPKKISTITTLTPKRKDGLRKLWGHEEFRRRWRECIDRVADSTFCHGQSDQGWVIDFDFFATRTDAWAIILTGRYDDRTENRRGRVAGDRGKYDRQQSQAARGQSA